MRRNILVLFFLVIILLPAAADAYGKRSIGRTSTRKVDSTSGEYIDQTVWLPGVWTVKTTSGSLTFTQPGTKPLKEVKLFRIPRDQCAYGIARMRALKAWGGKNLNQAQSRIEALSFGSLRFKGYTWVEPSTWKGERHFCIEQDLTGAVEIVGPEGDKELATFLRNDFLLQIANRRGRSVMPYPLASQKSSSSQH